VTGVFLPIAAVYSKTARPSHFRAIVDIGRITRMVAWQLLSRGFSPSNFFHVFIQPLGLCWRLDCLGVEGFWTLGLSNLLLLATGGLSGLSVSIWVYHIAKSASCQTTSNGHRIVFGQRLSREGQVTRDYVDRLERAKFSLLQSPENRILIVGGNPCSNALSEAQAGRDYLIAQGVPSEQIGLEDQSRHTLENLQRVRLVLSSVNQPPVILISNRYHLARLQAIATGLGLRSELCAAETHWQLTRKTLWQLVKEAYLLHWYYVGKYWAQLTRNVKMLKRIT
jgi:uncharacterized SAM-binding protein YcdF (DUF218 family)